MTDSSNSPFDDDIHDEAGETVEEPFVEIEKSGGGSPDLLSPEESPPVRIVEHSERREVRYRSAPLPTPEEFKEYGQVLPNAPERIMRMAENASESAIRSEYRTDNLIRYLMFGVPLIAIGCLVLAAYLAYLGYDVTGGITGLGGALAYMFSFGRGLFRRKPQKDTD